MARQPPIERGQRFRDLQSTSFMSARREWIVEYLFTATDQLLYARLVNASDLTQRKTISLQTLGDTRRFARL